MIRKFFYGFLLAFILVLPVRAEVDTATFLRDYERGNAEDRALRELMIASVNVGLQWANIHMIVNMKTTPMFCQPRQMALTPSQLIDILKRYVEKIPQVQTGPFGLTLYMSLKDVFPCGKEM